MAPVCNITQGPLTNFRKEEEPPGPASWPGVQRQRGFCLHLGVPTCWASGRLGRSYRAPLAGTGRAGRALGLPYLPGQAIREKGAEAVGELSTGHSGWVAGLSASLLVTQAAWGVCPSGEARGCCLPYTRSPPSSLHPPKLLPASVREVTSHGLLTPLSPNSGLARVLKGL